MIDMSDKITRLTTNDGRRVPGARVTLDFCSSLPLPPDVAVRLRYDLAGDGHFRDCAGIAQLTHTVARRGQLVVFHYRLSHWIAPRPDPAAVRRESSTATVPAPGDGEPAVDRSPA
jgi:hypothetical protein